MFCSTSSFLSSWKSLHGSVNSIAVGGSSTHLRHGLEKRRRRTIPWRVEFQLRCPLQGMRFQGKTKETLGCDGSPSGWIIRYEFLFVKYDWKRWRELLNFSSFPWNWRSEWCVYVAHLQLISHNFKRHVCMKKGSWVIQGRVIQTVGTLRGWYVRLILEKRHHLHSFDVFPAKNHVIFTQNAQESYAKNLEPRVQRPNLSTGDLACLVASPL